MATNTIRTTKNYRLFTLCEDNRPLNLKKRKRLRESMQEYGFLKSYPLSCFRNGDKKLEVRDGQHRLALAEDLGLPVHYCVEDIDYDIGKVNSTQEKWLVRDYAMMFASKGGEAYQEGLDFADAHALPIGTAFALLAGTTNWTNIQPHFVNGSFKVRDRAWADSVASLYVAIVKLSPDMKNARLMEACMALCRVDGFDAGRLLAGAKRCRDKLVSYSTRDAYLDLMEVVYNFGRARLVSLKNDAVMAMRSRNAATKKKTTG